MDMKRSMCFFMLALAVLTAQSCAMDTKGKKIDKYDAPKKALLVMDVQEDFTGGQAKMPVDPAQAQSMIVKINGLIERAKSSGVLVVYIRNVFPKSDVIGNLFRSQAAVENTEGIEFDKRLKVINSIIFTKNQPDAFSSADFEAFLIKSMVDELYLTGVFADQCVFWTSKGALNRGYKVEYIKDAVAARTQTDIENASESLEKTGAVILQAENAY